MAILRAHEAIDLMITDLLMPGMDGLALIRQARGLRPSLPAILLTGNAMEATEMDSAPPEQAYTLIRKPTTTEHLNARVTDLLERL
jgi:CheY-like chemotaxis protein